MKILFFTFYFPPDLSAGAFRSSALAAALAKSNNLKIHVITTSPNRYVSFNASDDSTEQINGLTIHRVRLPKHTGSMISQVKIFLVFALKSIPIAFAIKPNFIIGTTGRLMTGFLTCITSKILKVDYFVDIRDIFPESISDVFVAKSKYLARLFKFIFQIIEKIVIKNAVGINLVSDGFIEYFKLQNIEIAKVTTFTNGIDDEFINKNLDFPISKNKKLVVYAGNIGYGQGLEKIIPKCAKMLETKYDFVVIGDGNTKTLLKYALAQQQVTNVQLIDPVKRPELLKYYQAADILFLHLNNYDAFKRVLPSKIFEYAAYGKPIIAGVAGYAAEFLTAEVAYAFVFAPGNIEDCLVSFDRAEKSYINQNNIDSFINKFSRAKIMDNMAVHIMSCT